MDTLEMMLNASALTALTFVALTAVANTYTAAYVALTKRTKKDIEASVKWNSRSGMRNYLTMPGRYLGYAISRKR